MGVMRDVLDRNVSTKHCPKCMGRGERYNMKEWCVFRRLVTCDRCLGHGILVHHPIPDPVTGSCY